MLKALLYPVYKKTIYIIAFVWAITLLKVGVSLFLGIETPTLLGLDVFFVILALAFTIWFPDWYQGFLFRQQSHIKANPLLDDFKQGNYAPIQDEVTQSNLMVEGELPEHLNGMYVRNGPNPAFLPISYTYPIDGDGMLHAVEIREGKAHYRNRYVQTAGLQAEKRAGEALYGGISRIIPVDPKLVGKDPATADIGPIKNTASIHVTQVGEKYLAMYEAAPPYEVSKELETIGPWKPEGYSDDFHMNAHTRRDPKTGELYAFTYDAMSPKLKIYHFSAEGHLVDEKQVNKSYVTMVHDFVLTENYLVFFDCPAVFDAKAYWIEGQLLHWRPDLNTTIILVHRKTKIETRVAVDPFFVYHFANGYEEGDELIIDYIRHETFTLGDALHTDAPALHRMVIHTKEMHAVSHLLIDKRIEFPRINEAYLSKPYRYIYAPVKTLGHIHSFHAIIQFDLKTRRTYTHDFGENFEVGEPVFIPNPAEDKPIEDSGWVGFFVYDRTEDSSHFVLLDAQKITKKPVASIKMPHRVPHGLHGSWFTGSGLG